MESRLERCTDENTPATQTFHSTACVTLQLASNYYYSSACFRLLFPVRNNRQPRKNFKLSSCTKLAAFCHTHFSSAFCLPQFSIRIRNRIQCLPLLSSAIFLPPFFTCNFLSAFRQFKPHFAVRIQCLPLLSPAILPHFVIAILPTSLPGTFPWLGTRLFSFRIYPSPFSAIRIIPSEFFCPHLSAFVLSSSFSFSVFLFSFFRPHFVI